jgi:hypothetical protein
VNGSDRPTSPAFFEIAVLHAKRDRVRRTSALVAFVDVTMPGIVIRGAGYYSNARSRGHISTPYVELDPELHDQIVDAIEARLAADGVNISRSTGPSEPAPAGTRAKLAHEARAARVREAVAATRPARYADVVDAQLEAEFS